MTPRNLKTFTGAFALQMISTLYTNDTGGVPSAVSLSRPASLVKALYSTMRGASLRIVLVSKSAHDLHSACAQGVDVRFLGRVLAVITQVHYPAAAWRDLCCYSSTNGGLNSAQRLLRINMQHRRTFLNFRFFRETEPAFETVTLETFSMKSAPCSMGQAPES